MSDELKPCPFCGARAACSVGNASFSGVELMGAGTDRPYVWCGTCGSSGSFEDTDAKAVAAWNTRAPLADALAAALRSAQQSITRLIEAQGIDICTGCDTAVQLHAHRQDCAWSKIDATLAAYEARK